MSRFMTKPIYGSLVTQTGLYSNRTWLETSNLGLRKKRNCSVLVYVANCTIYMYVAKIKTQISCAITGQLICIFVFAYGKPAFCRSIYFVKLNLLALMLYLGTQCTFRLYLAYRKFP